jgi:hypothetical protein
MFLLPLLPLTGSPRNSVARSLARLLLLAVDFGPAHNESSKN